MKKLFILKNNPEIEVTSWDEIVDICCKEYSITPLQVTTAICNSSALKGEFSESNGICMYVVLTNKLGVCFGVAGVINFQP